MDNSQITRPTLILDKEKSSNNISRMSAKARRLNLGFRPHFKTHQSAMISEWLRQEKITTCTVSSVKMAQYFARHGWNDILIAFPVNIREAEAIAELAGRIQLQLLVYDTESVRMLASRLPENVQVGVKIEMDLGSKRSGVAVDDHEKINALLQEIRIQDNLSFTGFYSHPGHTYGARSKESVLKLYREIIAQLQRLWDHFGNTPGFYITIGDTPGCTLAEDFGPVDEISPGNFVFYDTMQVNIGSCDYDDIAAVVACPVVGKNADRNELLIHGGAVHFSKEILEDADGTKHFGKLANIATDGWSGVIPGAYLKAISQEHGLIHCDDEFLSKTKIGDLVYIYPAHSCLTADLLKFYYTTDQTMMSGEEGFMP